jgi:hypothetical protein
MEKVHPVGKDLSALLCNMSKSLIFAKILPRMARIARMSLWTARGQPSPPPNALSVLGNPWFHSFGCGGPRREFCAFLRLLFSNLYQISGHFSTCNKGFTGAFCAFLPKISASPFV